MKYLVVGSSGQLGKEICLLLKKANANFCAFSSNELDITNLSKSLRIIKKINPDVIFDCAAYTNVEKAECGGKETNWKVNVYGTRNISEVAKLVDAILIYISTDYVFDGTCTANYQVDDLTNPLNEYGRAKLIGEEVVKKYLKRYYIIRTSWLFGKYGNNFIYTMKNLAKTKNYIKVVNDQWGRPTWTYTLASFMLFLIKYHISFGTYHLSNEGVCTWFEFASEILKDDKVSLLPINSREYKQKAQRPQHSVLALEKTQSTGFKIPNWREALSAFDKEYKDIGG